MQSINLGATSAVSGDTHSSEEIRRKRFQWGTSWSVICSVKGDGCIDQPWSIHPDTEFGRALNRVVPQGPPVSGGALLFN